MALIPRSLDEAWKMADAFYVAGMVPKSLEGKGEKETKAKVMLAICKGAEVGFGPVTAVSTIMVINAKACLYGDGATSLVQNSGNVEWIKTDIASKDDDGKWGEGYKVTVSLKRKDQEEPYVRSFSFEDAKRPAFGKQGPWTDYPDANATGAPGPGLTATEPAMPLWAWRLLRRSAITRPRRSAA